MSSPRGGGEKGKSEVQKDQRAPKRRRDCEGLGNNIRKGFEGKEHQNATRLKAGRLLRGRKGPRGPGRKGAMSKKTPGSLAGGGGGAVRGLIFLGIRGGYKGEKKLRKEILQA